MASMRSWSGATLGRSLTPGTKIMRRLELLYVWRQYCAQQDVKTPMSPPGSDEEEAEESEVADESSESESEQEDEEEVGVRHLQTSSCP